MSYTQGLGIARLKHASLAAFKVQVALAARGGTARLTSGPATTASTRHRSRVRVASEQDTGMSPELRSARSQEWTSRSFGRAFTRFSRSLVHE